MKTLITRTAAAFVAFALVLPLLGTSVRAADPFIELVATDITLDETEFTYTGEEIRPNVTVRVNGQLLTLDRDYYLDYADNIEVGEAKVIVTGIATAGYAGTVEHPFFIREAETETEPEFTLVTLTEDMVTLDRTEYEYSGTPIEPVVTVTVDGKVLENGKDYAVEYVNNLIPGTGTVIVRGIATASETLGYTGEIRKTFTIAEVPQTEPTEPETSEPTRPSEPTSPSQPSEPTEPVKPVYKITKGNKSSWTQGSSAALSFTADGPFDSFKGVSVDGKKLDPSHYEAKTGTEVLLKNAYLKTLKTGDHKITLHFTDADAEGTFTVAAAGDNPKTGDPIAVWILTMTLTGTALVLLKKRFA